MPELFDKRGGFRKLHTSTLSTIVQLDTLRFCRRFITHDHREAATKFYDPKGRQYGQMTQAARSGWQNIIEGSERSATSKWVKFIVMANRSVLSIPWCDRVAAQKAAAKRVIAIYLIQFSTQIETELDALVSRPA